MRFSLNLTKYEFKILIFKLFTISLFKMGLVWSVIYEESIDKYAAPTVPHPNQYILSQSNTNLHNNVHHIKQNNWLYKLSKELLMNGIYNYV